MTAIRCITCGAKLKVKDSVTHGVWPCPKCGSMVDVSKASESFLHRTPHRIEPGVTQDQYELASHVAESPAWRTPAYTKRTPAPPASEPAIVEGAGTPSLPLTLLVSAVVFGVVFFIASDATLGLLANKVDAELRRGEPGIPQLGAEELAAMKQADYTLAYGVGFVCGAVASVLPVVWFFTRNPNPKRNGNARPLTQEEVEDQAYERNRSLAHLVVLLSSFNGDKQTQNTWMNTALTMDTNRHLQLLRREQNRGGR